MEGVSAVAVVALAAAYIYAHRAAAMGGRAVKTAGRTGAYLRVTALVLLALLIVGVVNMDVARASELLDAGVRFVGRQLP